MGVRGYSLPLPASRRPYGQWISPREYPPFTLPSTPCQVTHIGQELCCWDNEMEMKKTPLKKEGTSPTALLKKKIQALLRERAIERDGGCVLRHYPEAGKCGGYRKDGGLILQGEHLNGRSHAVSYGDMDNIVCLCKHHHIFFKKREPFLYWILIRAHIGEKRWEKVEAWTKDRSAHRMYLKDWMDVAEALS